VATDACVGLRPGVKFQHNWQSNWEDKHQLKLQVVVKKLDINRFQNGAFFRRVKEE